MSSKFSFHTTAEEVATEFAREISGKNVLVTGTSLNGIGFETARAIAKHANLVIITGYNEERLKLSGDAIKKDIPNANIRRLILDLSSLAAVRTAAAEVNRYPEPLHVLIHNAAATQGPLKVTVDNLESQMATAHIGPFLLTKLLTPKLLASASTTYTPRVVLKRPDPAKYHHFEAYYQAKSANVLTAIELSKRSGGKINAYSLHPGVIFTNLAQKEESKNEMIKFGLLDEKGQPNNERYEWKTIPEGAATTVTAAFDPTLNGAYFPLFFREREFKP
ncbi:Short-chain dehydrogenase/reductase family protein [Mycena venus]|uniref:Short-chain dehydrogenase/reductase family protein n=1 Tax=Mycena venus TaxID=2733690 RepID=A0A8H6YV18_9AGAR|nr:Short-chain dehydrogenase/reductase family protein [Mycena venus]